MTHSSTINIFMSRACWTRRGSKGIFNFLASEQSDSSSVWLVDHNFQTRNPTIKIVSLNPQFNHNKCSGLNSGLDKMITSSLSWMLILPPRNPKLSTFNNFEHRLNSLFLHLSPNFNFEAAGLMNIRRAFWYFLIWNNSQSFLSVTIFLLFEKILLSKME